MPCCPPHLLFRKQFSGASSCGTSKSTLTPTLTLAENIDSLSLSMVSEGEAPGYLLPSSCSQSILSGDIKRIVRLPKYISRDEWISSHGMPYVWPPLRRLGVVFEFFHLVNAFYESISEYCTSKDCGPMTLGTYTIGL